MLNLLRQTSVIPESRLCTDKVNILGVGAIGSQLTNQIARSGMLKATLWDFDQVESHNIPNQAFAASDVGRNKAEAMQEIVQRDTGLRYTTRSKYEGEPLSGIVFSCVDSMKVRKQILDNMTGGIFIEVRMGVYHGQVYSVRHGDAKAREFWDSRWAGDDVIEEKSACGTSLTIGATAQFLSSIAAWQAFHYMREEDTPKCITMCVNPFHLMEE